MRVTLTLLSHFGLTQTSDVGVSLERCFGALRTSIATTGLSRLNNAQFHEDTRRTTKRETLPTLIGLALALTAAPVLAQTAAGQAQDTSPEKVASPKPEQLNRTEP